jgi:hypothetical protein
MMAFLADLGDPEHHLTRAAEGTNCKRTEIYAGNKQVFPEISVNDFCSFLSERLDFVKGKQTDLPMPCTGMRISFYTPGRTKDRFLPRLLRRTFFLTGAYGFHRSFNHVVHPPIAASELVSIRALSN